MTDRIRTFGAPAFTLLGVIASLVLLTWRTVFMAIGASALLSDIEGAPDNFLKLSYAIAQWPAFILPLAALSFLLTHLYFAVGRFGKITHKAEQILDDLSDIRDRVRELEREMPVERQKAKGDDEHIWNSTQRAFRFFAAYRDFEHLAREAGSLEAKLIVKPDGSVPVFGWDQWRIMCDKYVNTVQQALSLMANAMGIDERELKEPMRLSLVDTARHVPELPQALMIDPDTLQKYKEFDTIRRYFEANCGRMQSQYNNIIEGPLEAQ